jgi:serine kinase of HPr protein (carbohydrate metabolism regulator)
MKVSELVKKLQLKIYAGAGGLENDIIGGYSSDLLSDVMGHASAGQIWITLQTHQNVMAIASLKELAAVVLVKGYEPEPGTREHGDKENIPVLGTEEEAFEISGKIYQLLKG